MKNVVLSFLIASGIWFATGTAVQAQSYGFSIMAGTPYAMGYADGTNGSALFDDPVGVTRDGAGNVYVADSANDEVRKLTLDATGTNWVVTTLAGLAGQFGSADGTNSGARFNYPYGIAVDAAGNLYVADGFNSTIRRIAPDATGTNWVVTTLAGLAMNPGQADGTNSVARFYIPTGIAVDAATNLYVADRLNGTIRKLTPDATGTNWVVTTLAGTAGKLGSVNGTNEMAQFDYPEGIARDSAGNLYVADAGGNTIRKVALDATGTNWVVTTLAGLAGTAGDADGIGTNALFSYPAWLAVDTAGNVFVSDLGNDALRRVNPAGVVNTLKLATLVPFGGPTGLVVDTNDDLYMADDSYTIRRGVPLAVPILQIALAGNQVVLSWPVAASNFVLQATTALSPNPVWAPVTNGTAAIVGSNFVLTNNANPGAVFYRMQNQGEQ